MAVFYGKDAGELDPETMPREGIDDTVLSFLSRLNETGYREGLAEKNLVLFKEPSEEGMSLVYVWFKSGYVLPFHSHDVDCLYYVLGGELCMGSRVLRKGDGFFIPAGHGYGYEAGPDGVEVLEFRNATRFNLTLRGNDEARWNRIVDTCRERAGVWAGETVPPSES
jgi:quercetin dioxygenase-like cupin family protein